MRFVWTMPMFAPPLALEEEEEDVAEAVVVVVVALEAAVVALAGKLLEGTFLVGHTDLIVGPNWCGL